MKECPTCNRMLESDEFCRDKSRPDGLTYECKACRRIRFREWHKEHSEETRDKRMLREYGISLDDYDQLWQAQRGVCAICGKTEEENGQRLTVDHNHETGEVRGLLCNSCNLGLGLLGDGIEIIRAVLTYLEATE